MVITRNQYMILKFLLSNQNKCSYFQLLNQTGCNKEELDAALHDLQYNMRGILRIEKKKEVVKAEIKDKETLLKLKHHPMWQTFNSRCISCGACTIGCATCTCFTTTDLIYNENANIGERRRTAASCQVDGFSDMAGGHSFRPTAGDRMRYKILHKFHDYKARFKDYHMCVGCGRCTSRCPEYISVTATVEKMSAVIDEIEAKGDNHE